MKYITVVKKMREAHTCPFCHEKPEHMLEEGKHFMVVPARAQYTRHHILIIPKRHANLLATLTAAEHKEMYTLVNKWTNKLHTKHKGVSLLLRDGLVKDKITGKSINHLHFHLLPDIGVEIESNEKAQNRIRLEDTKYTKIAQKYRKTFL